MRSAPVPDHRSDIDGLRGLAVGLVMAYHARLGGVPGGYVGVDIFLVLSGYLMTRMLLPRPGARPPGYLPFLVRRARRLFPAMAVMVAAVLPASVLILGPRDLASMGASTLAALFSVANLYFWGRHGYFASQAPEQPLLHTWSLGLEEQFYLVYPLALALLGRCRHGLHPAVVLGACVVSLAAPVLLTGAHPGAAFYLLPTRVWEFLLGGFVAVLVPVGHRWRGLREACTVLGLAGMAVAATCLSKQTPYPGAAVALPAVATALVLWANTGAQTAAAWPLRLRWLGAIGLLSYSLYLWHWPVLALARYALARDLEPAETLAGLGLVSALAWCSWRYIEQPFRAGAEGAAAPRPLAPILALAGFTAAAGLGVWKADGLPARMTARQLAIDPPVALEEADPARCHHGRLETVGTHPLCALSTGGPGARGLLLWGDSHANAMSPAMARLGAQRGFNVWQASFSSCPPLLDSRVGGMPAPLECTAFNDRVLQAVRTQQVRRVVLAAYWSSYLPNHALNPVARWLDPYDAPGALGMGSNEANRRNFERGLRATVAALQALGVEVWIVGQVPVQRQFVPTMLVQASRRGADLSTVGIGLDDHRRSQARVEEVMAELGSAVRIIDIAPALCPRTTCQASDGVNPFYVDAHHLSRFGAQRLLGPLGQAFD